MAEGKLCILTIHGIGFQQPPNDQKDPPVEGYADELHKNLSRDDRLGTDLGSDPDRDDCPVYVVSGGPRAPGAEESLRRLDGQLTASGKRFAHVALVYSPLEGAEPPPGAAAGAIADAVLMLGHYTSVSGVFRLVVGDALATLHEGANRSASPSLRPRSDLVTARQHHLGRLPWRRRPQDIGPLGIIEALEDDAVAYICRNDLRERIREFIAEALRRLLASEQVSGIVVNAHSQGTVDSFDVLRHYPEVLRRQPAGSASEVRAFVTSGSPLRKYADLFCWGNDAGGLQSIADGLRSAGDTEYRSGWLNFCDPHDPVADPLDPPSTWRFGDQWRREPDQPGLFWGVNGNGAPVPFLIDDREVDNLAHSVPAGGLKAHNYWDNPEFIAALAGLLKKLASS